MSAPRWIRRAVVLMLTSAIVVVFGTIGVILLANSRVEHIPDEDLPSLATPTDSTELRNFLVVGSDSRENLPDDFADVFGDFAGARADVIMLVHLAEGGRVQIVSLPRDLMVDIAGRGTNKINAAYAFGGPDLLVDTVSQETGIPIHHYIEVEFGGFANIVDALGGVTIEFPNPARDLVSGFTADAGSQKLNGEMALAYVRSRQYQELRDGTWTAVEASDIGRTHRQQQMLTAIAAEATSPGNIARLPTFLLTAAGEVTADAGLTAGVIADLALTARAVRADDVETITLPVELATIGGVSYVVPVEPSAGATLIAFAAGDPLP